MRKALNVRINEAYNDLVNDILFSSPIINSFVNTKLGIPWDNKGSVNAVGKQISKLSDAELRKMVVIANSAANKRIKRAESAGLTSGVIDRAKENGKFSVKGVENRVQLENAFTNVKNFLSAQTSSVAGIKKQQRKMFKNLAKIVNKELPPEEQINLSGQNEVDLKNISGLIWQQIDKLAKSGTTIIVTTHFMEEAENADRAITEPLEALCQKCCVSYDWVPSKQDLGKHCGIEVGAAAAAAVD